MLALPKCKEPAVTRRRVGSRPGKPPVHQVADNFTNYIFTSFHNLFCNTGKYEFKKQVRMRRAPLASDRLGKRGRWLSPVYRGPQSEYSVRRCAPSRSGSGVQESADHRAKRCRITIAVPPAIRQLLTAAPIGFRSEPALLEI